MLVHLQSNGKTIPFQIVIQSALFLARRILRLALCNPDASITIPLKTSVSFVKPLCTLCAQVQGSLLIRANPYDPWQASDLTSIPSDQNSKQSPLAGSVSV
jgi:hypothetical protein